MGLGVVPGMTPVVLPGMPGVGLTGTPGVPGLPVPVKPGPPWMPGVPPPVPGTAGPTAVGAAALATTMSGGWFGVRNESIALWLFSL
jgi:hypothetical protein